MPTPKNPRLQLSSPKDITSYILAPDPDNPRLTRQVTGVDHLGKETVTNVVEERPLTIFLNGQEIVTAMTIGDYPEYLALGFLRNQGIPGPRVVPWEPCSAT
jgi:FdhD protein